MATPQVHAANAAAVLRGMLRISPAEYDDRAVAAIIERAVADATVEFEDLGRRQIEEVRASARDRLATLLSSSPSVIYSFEARGDFAPTFVSENIRRVFGYDPSEYLVDPDFWRDRVHPDDLARVEAEISHLFGNGVHAVEYRFRRKDGSYCWVNDEQHLNRDENGEPLEIVGSWSDITARKEAEAAKDAARARLAQLISASPAVIYSFAATGDFAPTFVSENIQRSVRLRPWRISRRARISGVSGSIPTISPGSRPSSPACSRTACHSVEYRFRRKDGTYCWVNDEWRLVRDESGRPLEVVGSWSDITARKEAEEAADAARASAFAQLLATAPAVIYSFKATGDFAPTFISENIEPARLCAGRVSREPGFLAEPRPSRRLAARHGRVRACSRSGHHSWTIASSAATAATVGSTMSWHLLRDADGNPVEIVGSWSDISGAQARRAKRGARPSSGWSTRSRASARVSPSTTRKIAWCSATRDTARCCMATASTRSRRGRLSSRSSATPSPPAASPRPTQVGAERWLQERLERHRNPGPPTIQRRADGRWIQVSERHVGGGGTVAVYSDLTELKENEERVAKAHRLILESLHYASRIQSAMLPARDALATVTHDYFLIWEPRDIVGGDFFWLHRSDVGYYIIVGDCTGHGVPGAFMTLIACGLLDRHLRTLESPSPGVLLSMLHRDLQTLLGQDQGATARPTTVSRPASASSSEAERRLVFAGAHFSLWRARAGCDRGDQGRQGRDRLPALAGRRAVQRRTRSISRPATRFT